MPDRTGAPSTALDGPTIERTETVAVVGAGAGDGADHDAEFAAFMASATPALARTAWLLCGDAHRAEELVQQALIKTYLAWGTAREREPLAYARRVLANLRIDGWRKHRREVLTPLSEMPEGAVEASARQHAQRDELVRALRTLTVRTRRVVVLRHLVGLSEKEVAEDLGVSVGTVKSTASRGLAQLREVLGSTSATAGSPTTPDPSTPHPRADTASTRRTAR